MRAPPTAAATAADTADFEEVHRPWPPKPTRADLDAMALEQDYKNTLKTLGNLSPADYGRRRDAISEEFQVPLGWLDAEYKERRKATHPSPDKPAQARRRAHWEVEPCSEPVNGRKLLDDLCAVIARHIILPRNVAEAVALWILHAWSAGALDVSPYLMVVSPTKQCGKTTFLILMMWLTPRSILASNFSGPSVYRFIEEHEPTLLVDEADSFAKDDEALRGILNSGHTRAAAYTVRCVGEGSNMGTQEFSTWCPKIIASIGPLADTLMDRSLTVRLRRKTKGETVERRKLRDAPDLADLRSRCLRWAQDNMSKIGAVDVNTDFDNRLADNWQPLLAIAQLAGGDWPMRARAAALAIAGQPEEQDRKVELLADIRRVFNQLGGDRIGAEALVLRLIDLEETPWKEWRRDGKPITSRGVAFMLKEFGIRSRKVRGPADFHREDFEEAWASYLPPFPRDGVH